MRAASHINLQQIHSSASRPAVASLPIFLGAANAGILRSITTLRTIGFNWDVLHRSVLPLLQTLPPFKVPSVAGNLFSIDADFKSIRRHRSQRHWSL